LTKEKNVVFRKHENIFFTVAQLKHFRGKELFINITVNFERILLECLLKFLEHSFREFLLPTWCI